VSIMLFQQHLEEAANDRAIVDHEDANIRHGIILTLPQNDAIPSGA
jgi:hypothetical protein